MIIYILTATLLISLLSLVGIFSLYFKKKTLDNLLFYLVSLSVGALFGGAFLHLIPEAYPSIGSLTFIFVIAGFLLFFCVEKILHWHHCHKGECHIHPFGYVNLIGDAVHNFIDGLVIAGAFLTSNILGLTTTIIIALHELPQEIGEFGVLLYAGFKKKKALFYNFISALATVLGGIAGILLSSYLSQFIIYLLPLAAGGFLYISASDLVPELKKETSLKKSLIYLIIVILGILLIYSMKFLGEA